jgi:hypothetical protein
MKSLAIISSINKIYERFYVMPDLQLHMRRVSAVGELILSAESDASKDDVVAALLLHDLGNIVKFRLGDEHAAWKKIQQEMIAKYGSLDHGATEKMVHELGVNDRVASLIAGMGFDNLHGVIESTDRELQICLYSDQRVAPYGVVSLHERFADLRKRYKGTALASRFDEAQEERALLVEQQIFNDVSLKPAEINDQTIAGFLK